MAKAIRAKGVRTIEGDVSVDTFLGPDSQHEGGTDIVLSSIIVNDNVVDLTGKPGSQGGDPITITISPETGYVHFVDKLVTGTADGKPQPDGSIEVTLTGSIPWGREAQTGAYAIPSPTRFFTPA